jgi:parvulin-like peptidyl-prolyl isomerase
MAKLLRVIFLFLFIAGYGLLVTGYELFAEDKIIAIVNKDVITQKDLDDFIHFTRVQLSGQFTQAALEDKIEGMKPDLLQRLIEDRLILQEAKKMGIKIDRNRIKARISEIRKNYGTDSGFQESLKKQGMVEADIESKIEDQLLMYNIIEGKIKSRIIIKPAEVTDFYTKNIQDFQAGEEREFDSIVVSSENTARDIYRSLKEGKALGDLLKQYKLQANKVSAHKGGELRQDIEEAVFKLNKDDFSEPVKIGDNFYIFKVNNIIPSRQQSLSEVQDSIYSFLHDKKMQEELTKWLDELKKNAFIKIL